MTSDDTQYQSPEEQQKAQERSLQRTQPPTDVPGYEMHRFLGAGAYGEVWVGVDKNTGRQVAIKFFLHRGGVDWSLLSKEVEKLVFLSADRYVVQLLDVGWDSEPPYYVMEYVENGSLEAYLRRHDDVSVEDAVAIFREMATGLMHAHGRGVLHCDLKPDNILLDQDQKPRLADFGQSRLSHEQTPALGTLFYMAPEQADLKAVPDARWDVYALGAILYRMLTGKPPYRTSRALDDMETASGLDERLARYREFIFNSPPPAEHRNKVGIDRPLIDILDRCLIADPNLRFPNVQSILSALNERETARQRRPLMVLGVLGPIVLLTLMVIFGWRGYDLAIKQSEAEIVRLAAANNRSLAQVVSQTAAYEIDRYFSTVESAARDPALLDTLQELSEYADQQPWMKDLRDPKNNAIDDLAGRQTFIDHQTRQDLQSLVASYLDDPNKPPNAASWFVCGPQGVQYAAEFADRKATSTVGKNYAWRTYFTGLPDDLKSPTVDLNGKEVISYRLPEPGSHLQETHLSAPFRSQATNSWKVAISTPVYEGNDPEKAFLGIVAMTIDIGHFSFLKDETFAVLVYGSEGQQEGMILHHPIFNEFLAAYGPDTRLPDSFSDKRAAINGDVVDDYQDPFGSNENGGKKYQGRWLAARAPVSLARMHENLRAEEQVPTGLEVIVQESYDTAVQPVENFADRMLRLGIFALCVVLVVVSALWYFVVKVLKSMVGQQKVTPSNGSSTPAVYEMETLAESKQG